MSAKLVVAVNSLLTTESISQVVGPGSSVEFVCGTDTFETVRWVHVTPGASAETQINNKLAVSRQFSDRYSVNLNKTSGLSTLTVSHVYSTDAGTFKCYEYNTFKASKSFQLVVIVANTYCSYASVDDERDQQQQQIEIQCSLEYCGNLQPVIQCVTSGGQWHSGSSNPDRRNVPVRRSTYYKVFNVSDPPVSCLTSFDSTNGSQVLYQQSWSFISSTTSKIIIKSDSEPISWLDPQSTISSRINTETTNAPKHEVTLDFLSIGMAAVVVVLLLIIAVFVTLTVRKRSSNGQSVQTPTVIVVDSNSLRIAKANSDVKRSKKLRHLATPNGTTTHFGDGPEHMTLALELQPDRHHGTDLNSESGSSGEGEGSYESLDETLAEIGVHQPPVYNHLVRN